MDFAIVSERLLQWWSAAGAWFPQVSDPLLQLACYSGIGAGLASVAMLAAIATLRIRLLSRRRRDRRFLAVWRPLMAQCMESVPASLPPLAAADRDLFLRLWNHYHESLRGSASGRLNELAESTGVPGIARAMLGRRSLRDRLIAAVTLGHLGDKTAWHELRRLAGDASSVLSLAAAHSMLRIEPASVLVWLIPLAAGRYDWPLARVAAMLAEAGADRVTPALATALRAAGGRDDPERLSRLLHLCEMAHIEQFAPEVRRLLAEVDNERVIADALGVLRDPRDVELVRRHAAHRAWAVRVSAAKALGRIGTPDDRGLLVTLLADPNWWVRHRAAQSLAGLPSVGIEELRAIRAGLTGNAAVQALDQAMAEAA